MSKRVTNPAAIWAAIMSIRERLDKIEYSIYAKQPITVSIDTSAIEDRIMSLEAAAQKHRAQFSYGTRVRWRIRTGWKAQPYVYSAWTGRVIPRPFDAKRYGSNGDEFVHVLTDDGRIRSCYAYNLEVLT